MQHTGPLAMEYTLVATNLPPAMENSRAEGALQPWLTWLSNRVNPDKQDVKSLQGGQLPYCTIYLATLVTNLMQNVLLFNPSSSQKDPHMMSLVVLQRGQSQTSQSAKNSFHGGLSVNGGWEGRQYNVSLFSESRALYVFMSGQVSNGRKTIEQLENTSAWD